MDQLIEINSLEEYEKAIQTKSIILFTASWCPDCMSRFRYFRNTFFCQL